MWTSIVNNMVRHSHGRRRAAKQRQEGVMETLTTEQRMTCILWITRLGELREKSRHEKPWGEQTCVRSPVLFCQGGSRGCEVWGRDAAVKDLPWIQMEREAGCDVGRQSTGLGDFGFHAAGWCGGFGVLNMKCHNQCVSNTWLCLM